MVADESIASFIINAGPVVKSVLIVLAFASITSWTFIFQKYSYLRRIKKQVRLFEDKFWSGVDLTRLYSELERQPEAEGLVPIFRAGFREFLRLRKIEELSPEYKLNTIQRAMSIEQARAEDKLEQHLSFLATVGSTSPYVGLFGTVWGIMTSFKALGNVQQATIAMVAPGISEALIATAIGLFAAIPAVIAYNRYSHSVEKLLDKYQTYGDELASILLQQPMNPESHPNGDGVSFDQEVLAR